MVALDKHRPRSRSLEELILRSLAQVLDAQQHRIILVLREQTEPVYQENIGTEAILRDEQSYSCTRGII